MGGVDDHGLLDHDHFHRREGFGQRNLRDSVWSYSVSLHDSRVQKRKKERVRKEMGRRKEGEKRKTYYADMIRTLAVV